MFRYTTYTLFRNIRNITTLNRNIVTKTPSASLLLSSSSTIINNRNNHLYTIRNYSTEANNNDSKDILNQFFKPEEEATDANDDTQRNNENLFIQAESTPNPDSLKFIPGVKVLDEGKIVDFPDFKSSQSSPLANALFKLDGVNRVFFSSNFISVNKFTEVEWGILKPQIFGTIIDFYHSGKPIISEGSENENSDTTILPEDDETVAMIKELIETRIRPTVLEDGGNIQYCGFKDGIVMVKLQGTCSSCSSSQATLKGGIERMLMHWISDVRGVIAVTDDELEQLNLDYFNSVESTLEDDKKN
ncbi:hypothetical protein CYY_001559 [Polysphondylium violaceum]|uniref:Scaffold protein Nfu/NifU N-terminal domain-containing protein n=1 Tax=Polysphondylium violaceum TaxID=133409 RepID=A0A8J4Q2V2_9MYCE|nr:hypothetical protein CYY_001559 [Polysphondylium violaceum]